MGAVHVYSLADGKATQVTDGMSDASDPVWDRSGKYLYLHRVDRFGLVAAA